MEENKLLFQLPYGELSVDGIRRELIHRKVSVPFGSKLLKADLSEVLRMTLEKTQTPGQLATLRAYEIAAITSARPEVLVARLKSRGIAALSSREGMMRRLYQALVEEKEYFQRQNKENIPPFQDGCKNKETATAITPEQRQRMERNRKRAYELQAAREKHKHQRTDEQEGGTSISVTPIRASGPSRSLPDTPETFIEMPAESNAFDYCSPVKISNTTTPRVVNPYSTLKSTGMASPLANLYSPVAPRNLHADAASTISSLHTTPTQGLVPCSRCGDGCGKQNLCIVWNHFGDIKMDDLDQYRWDCCGRLDGQPCHIGLHSRGSATIANKVILCECGLDLLARMRRTRKPSSANRGRFFFTCSSCKFFRWVDKAYGLPKEVPCVAPDGVREWEVPYANPFGETAATTTNSSTNKRQQLVAALLLQEMCSSAQKGQGGNGICSKELASRVLHTVHNGGDAILWKLQPLTFKQLAARFDWPNTSLIGLHDKECEQILLDLLERSQWVKSIGVRHERGPTGSRFLDLSGLEAYLNC